MTLHDQIMDIQCDETTIAVPGGAVRPYLAGCHTGHKMARHAAAELATPFDAFVAEMRKVQRLEIGGAHIAAALKRLDGETP